MGFVLMTQLSTLVDKAIGMLNATTQEQRKTVSHGLKFSHELVVILMTTSDNCEKSVWMMVIVAQSVELCPSGVRLRV